MNTEDKSVFDYIADNLGPAFPLDWSMNKWCEEYSRPNRKTVKRYTVKSNLFKPFFDGTRSSKNSGSPQFYDRSEYNHDGIPTELEDFFRSYIDTVTKFTAKKGKNTRLKDILNGESSEFDRVFCRHCVSQASISASSDKDDSYSAFLRKCLYENDAFVSEKISMSWDTVQCRMDTLKKLVLKKPAELQIQHIKNILAFLDMEIATVLPTDVEKPADTPPEKNPMPFTSTLPTEVIQKARQFTSNAANGHITYHIPNINFKDPSNPQNTINMETACSKISKMSPERKTLLPAAQEAYKKFLNEQASEKSEFQRQCEHLDAYVYGNFPPMSDDTLKAEIESITKSYFSAILSGHSQPFDIRVQVDKFQQSNSSEHFRTLHDIICSFCNQFISRYQQSIASLSMCDQKTDLCLSLALIATLDKNADYFLEYGKKSFQESTTENINLYKQNIRNIYPAENRNSLDELNNHIKDNSLNNICQKISDICDDIYKLFSVPKPYWTDKVCIHRALESYRDLLMNTCVQHPGIVALTANINFTRYMLIKRISYDYTTIQKLAFNFYTNTTKYIKGKSRLQSIAE